MGAAVRAGQVFSWSRRFTPDDVRTFAELSQDRGAHHLEPDACGRLMVHGLLTASIPTKLGGDLDYLARQMIFEFLRPVWTGDTIRCEMQVGSVEEDERRYRLTASVVCTNQDGDEVLRATTHGVILKPRSA